MALREEKYWDEHYRLELNNYVEDGDEGEIWFGKGLSRKIIQWIVEHISSNQKESNINIIDVGCGNAHLLYSFMDNYHNKFGDVENKLIVLGIDYSSKSIELSNQIISNKNYSKEISLKQCDFLNQDQLKLVTNNSKFDFIIDKGTFDAICLLGGQTEAMLASTKLDFMKSLYSLVKNGTIFILASCNNTKDELLSLFEINCDNKRKCEMISEIETPKIKFGGQEGSQVTCIILKFH